MNHCQACLYLSECIFHCGFKYGHEIPQFRNFLQILFSFWPVVCTRLPHGKRQERCNAYWFFLSRYNKDMTDSIRECGGATSEWRPSPFILWKRSTVTIIFKLLELHFNRRCTLGWRHSRGGGGTPCNFTRGIMVNTAHHMTLLPMVIPLKKGFRKCPISSIPRCLLSCF